MKNKVSQDYSFGEQFYVVLITSRLPDYQLAWALNNHLKVDFRKLPDLEVFHQKKEEDLLHTLFGWSSPNAIDYFLITSSKKPDSLSAETFLLIEKRERKETVDRFIEKASASEFIFSIEEISFDKPAATPKQKQLMKHLDNIAIDIEKHLDTLKKAPKYHPQK
jgi:hypothetical protein